MSITSKRIQFNGKQIIAEIDAGILYMKCMDHEPGVNNLWCGHLRELITSGCDASFINPDTLINVPIFPAQGIYATVMIGSALDNSQHAAYAPMSLEYTPDIGKPFKISLGFWNEGEGLWSIRGVILDAVKNRLHSEEEWTPSAPIKTPCPSTTHGLRASRIMATNYSNAYWKQTCLWNIAMEKACTPCVEEAQGIGDNYGITDDAVGTGKPAWRSSNPYA